MLWFCWQINDDDDYIAGRSVLFKAFIATVCMAVSCLICVGLPEVSQCSVAQFTCDDQTCIPLERKCDGVPDCWDRSDETDCGTWP